MFVDSRGLAMANQNLEIAMSTLAVTIATVFFVLTCGQHCLAQFGDQENASPAQTVVPEADPGQTVVPQAEQPSQPIESNAKNETSMANSKASGKTRNLASRSR